VEQSAESVASSEVVDLGSGALGQWSKGSGLAERGGVTHDRCMALVLTERYCCVLLVDDQDVVEESRWMVPTKRSAMALARVPARTPS
jgi:hypothetical protein